MTVTVNEYPLPSASGSPSSLTTGPDGNLWFVEDDGLVGWLGDINPTTHAIATFPIPTAESLPAGITAGPDGNLWFTEESAGKIGEINPTTHAISEFPVPDPLGPLAITTGPDGNLWFTENSAIGTINPTTHAIDIVPVPMAEQIDAIAVGPDGNLWFVADETDQIGMVNPTTHAVVEFPLPPQFYPEDIAAGPDGNLWFTGLGNVVGNGDVPGQIGMISATTHAITVFQTPSGWPATGITTVPDGTLVFLEFNWAPSAVGGTLGMIDPTTHAITEMLLGADDTEDSTLERITTGPDGHLWSTLSDAIEEFQITPSVAVSPQPKYATPMDTTRRGVASIWLAFNTALAPTSANEPNLYGIYAAVTRHGKTHTGRELSIKKVEYDVPAQAAIIVLSRPHQGTMQVVVRPGLLTIDGLASSSPFAEIVRS
jgi:streptogramin lyase